MVVSVRTLAKRETRDAAKWYEKQQSGLGDEFLQEVDRVFRAIMVDPRRFPFAEGEIRVAKTDRFPYAISPHSANED
jgi:toxin ParE1/3/4